MHKKNIQILAFISALGTSSLHMSASLKAPLLTPNTAIQTSSVYVAHLDKGAALFHKLQKIDIHTRLRMSWFIQEN